MFGRGFPRRAWDALPSAPDEWDTRSLRLALVAGAAVAVLLAVGLVYGLATAFGGHSTGPGRPAAAAGSNPEDRIAEQALPGATVEAARPGPLSTAEAGAIELPASTDVGPAQVSSGFPRTPEGAMAQLIAINREAIEGGSVARAQAVIAEWAMPGGPDAQSWSGVKAVAEFLSAAGLPATGDPAMQLRMDPSMGFIKGTVGDRFVVPCVDFTLVAGFTQIQRVATADCQRMVWSEGRWMIGAGPEPAPAPSLWPGTQAAYDAGYMWLTAERVVE